jgi:hypothetical protein
VAKAVASDLDRRFRAVEQLAGDRQLQRDLQAALANSQLKELRDKLNDPNLPEEAAQQARQALRSAAALEPLRKRLETLYKGQVQHVDSWFITDDQGLQLARWPLSDTVARNYAWRTYFSGRQRDEPTDWRPGPDDHVKSTRLSAVFASRATSRWAVAVSTPIVDEQGKFLGVAAMTVMVGEIVELKGGDEQFPVLVDWREGDHRGLILQHPLYDQIEKQQGALPENLSGYELAEADLPEESNVSRKENYCDKLGEDSLGADYRGRYLAEMQPVVVDQQDLGWRVIVQQEYETALGGAIDDLERGLFRSGLLALAVIATVITGLWAVVIRILRGPGAAGRFTRNGVQPSGVTLDQTLPHTPRDAAPPTMPQREP